MNSQLPVAAMERLAKDSSGIVRRALATNHATPAYLLERMVRRSPDDGYKHVLLSNVAVNPTADGDLLASLLRVNTSVTLAVAVAQHPNTQAATLNRLMRNPAPLVRLQVAMHPNASSEALIQLVADPDPGVRSQAAKNPNLPPHVKAIWSLANNG